MECVGWIEVLWVVVVELCVGVVVVVFIDMLYGLVCVVSCLVVLCVVYCFKGCSEVKFLVVCFGCVVDVYRYCCVRVFEGFLKDLLLGLVILVMECLEEFNKDLNFFMFFVGIWIFDYVFM